MGLFLLNKKKGLLTIVVLKLSELRSQDYITQLFLFQNTSFWSWRNNCTFGLSLKLGNALRGLGAGERHRARPLVCWLSF